MSISAEFKKFTTKAWNLTEEIIHDNKKLLIINILANTPTTFIMCGHYYLTLREKFYKILKLPPILEPPLLEPLDSNLLAFSEYMIIHTFYENKQFDDLSIFSNYSYFEVKIIALMHIARCFIDNPVNLDCGYELYIGIKKIIENNVITPCISDLNYMLSMVKNAFEFKYETLLDKYSNLCEYTKFDALFPTVKPLQSQVDVISGIQTNNPLIMLYNSPNYGGKTSTSIMLAKYCESVGKTLLFVCFNELDRIEVCNWMYNLNIPFGIAAQNKVTNNNRYKDVSPVIIISDIKTAILLIDQSENLGEKYVIFLDDPLIHIKLIKPVADILRKTPKTLIIASSIPILDNMILPIINHYKTLYSNLEIKVINSNDLCTECHIYSGDMPITPYQGCTNREELQKIITQIETSSQIRRLLNPFSIFTLYNKIKPYFENQIINLESYFDQAVCNINLTNIQSTTIQLLNGMMQLNNENIAKICCTEPLKPTYDSHILSTSAYKYTNSCLYLHSDPFKLAHTLYNDLISVGKKNICVVDVINRYNYQLDKCRKADNWELMPTINFPQFLQVNSEAHLQYFAPEKVNTIQKNLIKKYNNLDLIPQCLNISNWLYYLLFCGVGVYAPNDSLATYQYNEFVSEMAQLGNLAFIISSENIGDSRHVIVDDTFTDNYPINYIFYTLSKVNHIGPKIFNKLITNNNASSAEVQNLISTFMENVNSYKILHNGNLVSVQKIGLDSLRAKTLEKEIWKRKS
jgi:hypothetical protein